MVNDYEIKDDLLVIYLLDRNKNVKTTILELEDLDKLVDYKYSWNLYWSPTTKLNYVKSSMYLGTFENKPKYETIWIHRFILGVTDKKIQVDHINNDPLDNRKSNLRLVNNYENHQNRRTKANFNSKTGVRNVSYSELLSKFIVQFWDGFHNIQYGRYDTLEEATEVANKNRYLYQKSKEEIFNE